MAAHAKLSASGASRWANCPGSVKASEGVDNTSSKFAAEGTAMHEVAELALTLGHEADEYVGREFIGITITQTMADLVQVYLDYVRSITGELFVEIRVDFSEWVPEGFGTSDAIVLDGDTLHVIDLKTGKGVQVFAEENLQGMLYALGSYEEFGYLANTKTVRIHIVQPALDHIDTWDISLEDLLVKGEWFRERAELALTPDAPRIPGETQCQWCPVKATCPALISFTEELIMCDFDNLDDLPAPVDKDDEILRKALAAKSLIMGWLTAVEKEVYDRLVTRGSFTGFKLVEGRSNRAWTDETVVGSALVRELGNEVYTTKLITPAQAEKLLGKKRKDLLEGLITKPPGKATLVPESDKRPPLGDVTACFDDLTEGDE